MHRTLHCAIALAVSASGIAFAAEKPEIGRVSWSKGPLSPVQLQPAVSGSGIGVRSSYAFPPFVAGVTDTLTATVLPTGAVPAGVYNHITITTDWIAGPGDPYSAEAEFALATGTDPGSAAPIYKYLTSFPNGQLDGSPVTLGYSGFLYNPYTGGAPLSLFADQAFPGSAATWSNISITIEQQSMPIPSAVQTSTSGSLTGSLTPGQIDWYRFAYDGSAVTIDTEGSTLGPDNDTTIALFNAAGGLEAVDDDSGTGFLSSLAIPAGVLPAGDYYLAVFGYGDGNAFDDGFTIASDSVETGAYRVNGISVVPEPTLLAGLATLGILMVRRRRT